VVAFSLAIHLITAPAVIAAMYPVFVSAGRGKTESGGAVRNISVDLRCSLFVLVTSHPPPVSPEEVSAEA
jgi:hypothetical protein